MRLVSEKNVRTIPITTPLLTDQTGCGKNLHHAGRNRRCSGRVGVEMCYHKVVLHGQGSRSSKPMLAFSLRPYFRWTIKPQRLAGVRGGQCCCYGRLNHVINQ